MPGMNGTGPLGKGPGTGRGMGPCGQGQAYGRGACGRGRGRGFGGAAQGTAGQMPTGAITGRIETLENELRDLKDLLRQRSES